MNLKHSLAAGLFLTTLAGAAMAQTPPTGGGATVVTRPDGTRIETTVLGPTSIRIVISGGPDFTNSPATVNFTNITASGTTQTYTGDVTQNGVTSPFTCMLNSTTGEVTGSGACAVALGSGSSTTPTTPPPAPPTTPTTPPPTTPTTPTTPVPPPTPAEPTMVAPDGTVITIAAGNLRLLTAVQTDQFLNSLLGDALSSSFGQAFVAARMQVLSAGAGRLASNDAYRGLSAGDVDSPLGLWLNATGVRLRDDRAGRNQKGWARSVAAGVDYQFEGAVLGAFASYGDTDLDGPSVNYEADGWTGGLYGSFRLIPNVSLTGVVGYNAQDVENDRSFGILSSRGKTDRKQVFGSVTLEGEFELAPSWLVLPAASVFLSDSRTDGYVDSGGRAIARVDNRLSILRTGATLFHQGEFLSPYLSASWDHYLGKEAGTDNDYGRVGGGVSISMTPATYLAIGASTTVARKNERETLYSLTLGGRF